MICEGMEFLHSNVYADGKTKKVLFHQDLKSGNILLCMEGNPSTLRGKISDFGLSCKFHFHLTQNLVLKDNPINRNARNTDVSSSSSKVSINGGTGCYQAPELFKKNAKSRDEQMSLQQESSF
jgi:serine/threonine protein kinase